MNAMKMLGLVAAGPATGPQSPQASNDRGVSGACSTFGQNGDRNSGVGNTVNGQEIPGLPG